MRLRWRRARNRFDLAPSELVVLEGSAGNEDAASARLAVLDELRLLEATDETAKLTEWLLELGAVPRKAAQDAAQIAMAVTNGADYLVTWSFRHIANAVMRTKIEKARRRVGFEPVILCTPGELMESLQDDAAN